MKNIVVIKIHNASVSSVYSADSIEDAKDTVGELFFNQFDRLLDNDELNDLDNKWEVYNDEDHDNTFTFSIYEVNDKK